MRPAKKYGRPRRQLKLRSPALKGGRKIQSIMKILVTGGAGFIGSHLTDALIKNQHQVVIVDNLSTGQKQNINQDAKFFELDIQNQKLENIFKKFQPKVIFHLAAQIDVRKSVSDPITDAHTNILGSINVLENAHAVGCKKIIFSSTGGAIYGDAAEIPTTENYPVWPISPYGIAKLTVEHYLHYYYQVFKIPYVALRYANVYGPRQNSRGEAGVVAIFCDKILNKQQPEIFGSGRQTRDYVYVDDVVAANLAALATDKVGCYNVGTAKETNVNQIAELIKNAFGAKIEFIHGPAKPGEQQRSCLDWKKIQLELGWSPRVGLEEGIEMTARWFRGKF